MNRISIINQLIKDNEYKSYLEIGVARKHICFDKIDCKTKISVDPAKIDHYDFNMTSDEFFQINTNTFDIIFIDGLHTAEQVEKDINNSLLILNNNGTIVVHDTNPSSEFSQMESQANALLTPTKVIWHGTVWKAIFKLRKTRNDIIIETYDCDEGVTTIKRGYSDLLLAENPYYSYYIFDKDRSEILNLKTKYA